MNRPAAGVVTGTALIAGGLCLAFVPNRPGVLSALVTLGGLTLLFGSLIVLGARPVARRLPPLFTAGLVGLALLLLGCFGAALLLPSEPPDAPLFLGLPRRAALLVYGVGLLPAAVLPVVFAATFRELIMSAESLAEFRARLAALRRGEGDP